MSAPETAVIFAKLEALKDIRYVIHDIFSIYIIHEKFICLLILFAFSQIENRSIGKIEAENIARGGTN